MAGQSVQLTGIVLKREASGELYYRVNLICPDQGSLMVMMRRPKRNIRTSLPDLFDEVELVVERKSEDSLGFVKELTIHQRRRDLAKSFIALELACEWSTILIKNLPRHLEVKEDYDLLIKGLEAWETRKHPEAVFFKCLFVYARKEGYAVKHDWFENLPHNERVSIASILNTPIAQLEIEPAEVRKHIEALKHYIQHHTDILL
ncbi:MAG: recombination protein O N-terminal domain-containing protein [Verrucomicrobiae bacterium]|nr:recombination protein O N-terminal domain-containing protein [Verrucomicrobiae bacterium]